MKAINTGFTLIELLIVVLIIAILAAIAVPNFLEAQVRSKVSRTKADIRTLATALEAYAADNDQYPHVLNPPPVSRLYRLKPLTTPIRYISSIFPDVFNTKDQDTAGAATDDPPGRLVPAPEIRIVVYWAPPWLDLTLTSPTYESIYGELDHEWGLKGQWMLLSFGPDAIYDINYPSWPSVVHIYDPTNGTISRGDIIRSKKHGQY
jgi:prepilin-type N-terminal cleavage/methylation domain-containing protein